MSEVDFWRELIGSPFGALMLILLVIGAVGGAAALLFALWDWLARFK